MSCPICGKETVKPFRPFCSKRCADIDLAKWFNEEYTVPAEGGDPYEEVEIQQPQTSDRLH